MHVIAAHLNAEVILVVTVYSYVKSPSSPTSWDHGPRQYLFRDNLMGNNLNQPASITEVLYCCHRLPVCLPSAGMWRCTSSIRWGRMGAAATLSTFRMWYCVVWHERRSWLVLSLQ